MGLEEVLVRVELIRVRPEVAASAAELENAAHLSAIVGALWVYWQRLLGEFGARLLHWGNRGNAALGNGRFLFIRLDTGHWRVQRKGAGGWVEVGGDWGLETLRVYLEANRPQPRGPRAHGDSSAEEAFDIAGSCGSRRRGN